MGHDGIAPAELLERSRRQLECYETITSARRVVSTAEQDAQGFVVRFETGELVRARTLLVATGVVDEVPQVEGIAPLFGRSVHVCPYCDGWEHRNAPVAVYGRGEKAVKFAVLIVDQVNVGRDKVKLLFRVGTRTFPPDKFTRLLFIDAGK